MALFKILKGSSKTLPTKITEGYAYFTTDEGNLFIDISGTQRVQVNAKGAANLIRDGEYIEADQFVTIDDNINVAHGGTGATTLTANAVLIGNGTSTIKMVTIPAGQFVVGDATNGIAGKNAADTRSALDVYSKSEVDSKVSGATTIAYTTTLTATGWSGSGSSYTQTWLQSALKCGKNGNVPPIVSYTSNQAEYSKIDRAEATAGQGITFYSSVKPSANIGLVIVDMM